MFSVVRQCTLCVLYASTLRSVLRVLSYSRVSSSVAPTPSSIGRRNERAKHRNVIISKCITSVELLYLVFSIVPETRPGARVVGVRAVCELRFRRAHDDTRVALRGSVSSVVCGVFTFIDRRLSNRANLNPAPLKMPNDAASKLGNNFAEPTLEPTASDPHMLTVLAQFTASTQIPSDPSPHLAPLFSLHLPNYCFQGRARSGPR